MTLLGAKRDLLVVHESPNRWERALALFEFEDYGQDGKSVRRWQRIRMLRGDRVIDFDRDLGPASNLTAGPLVVVGALDCSDTVGELQDEADAERESLGLAKFLAEKREQSTFKRDLIEQQLMTEEYRKQHPVSARHFVRR